eukprot:NODE_1944_length_1348_cov_36.176289_g1761_i0.p1 GENE.NODE_1944_length_1348_cov_36.176289_g1761_i0~~NODE_1944_length_1348_cov_36.176289_g1761_i0.p1  ORF type:complete len:404 (+),score=83.92 NODE_1944_length_1348_cov_36.176289_g1761_i0:61-1212(+)
MDTTIASMAECLLDASPLVRHTALLLLSQMLAEGYTKWTRSLVICFLAATADPDSSVGTYAKRALVQVHLPKQPSLFLANFIPAVLMLNEPSRFSSWKAGIEPGAAVPIICGEAHAERRLTIYQLMLQHMPLQQRARLHKMLHTDLLAFCVEDTGDLTTDTASQQSTHSGRSSHSVNVLEPPGSDILRDVLSILSLREMRLGTQTLQPVADEEETGQGSAAIQAVSQEVFRQVLVKHLEDSVIPIVVDLKRWLRRHRSPHMRWLDVYLRCIAQDFQPELRTLLEIDPQLALELDYETERERSARRSTGLRRGSGVAAITPSHGSLMRQQRGGTETHATCDNSEATPAPGLLQPDESPLAAGTRRILFPKSPTPARRLVSKRRR